MDLLVNMARSRRFNTRGQCVEPGHNGMKIYGVFLHHFHWFQLLDSGFFKNWIIAAFSVVLQMARIGNVAHIAHFVAQVFQISKNQVEREKSAAIAQMHIAINSWAANVHTHCAFVNGSEFFLAFGKRIVNI